MLEENQFKLFPDQEISVAKLLDKIKSGEKRLLFVGATGSGKTVISAELMRRIFPAKVLFVVHRQVLIRQTIKTLTQSGFPRHEIGVIAAGYDETRDSPVQIASLMSIHRRDSTWFDWDLTIFDEGHTTGFSTWGKKVNKENEERQILYLTATPWRLSKKEAFSEFIDAKNYIFAPPPKQLIEMGRLTKPRYFKALEVDLDNVQIQAGDYQVGQLEVVCDTPEVIKAGLEALKKLASNRRIIGFPVTVKHGQNMVDAAIAHGYKAVLIHAGIPEKQRDQYYKQLDNFEIDMIVSVDCLSEGFDVKAIGAIWGLRPTKSKSKFFQQLGRGLRTAEGKVDCIILDQAQNLMCHGLVEYLEEQSFFDATTKSNSDGVAPIKYCEDCSAIIHAAAKQCPECGYMFPVKKKSIGAAGKIVEIKAEHKQALYGGLPHLPRPKLNIKPQKILPLPTNAQEYFFQKLDHCMDMCWHPLAAIIETEKSYGDIDHGQWLKKWTEEHGHTVLDIYDWLKQVDDRRQDEGQLVKEWMHKLFHNPRKHHTFPHFKKVFRKRQEVESRIEEFQSRTTKN